MPLSHPSSRSSFVLCLAAVLALTACNDGTKVRSTVPSSNESGVSARALIAIRLSNTVSSADDGNISDPSLFQVRGDFTDGLYPGTVALADWDRDVRPGMTVDEFSQGLADGGGDGEVERELDALVFLLSQGVSFKPGETITVIIDHDITAHGVPLERGKTFSFRVGDSATSEGALRIVTTDPAAGAQDAPLAPRIRARFNRGVAGAGLAEAISIRGERSFFHSGIDTLFTQEVGAGVLEVVQRLAAGDAFVPGETVEVAFSSDIQDAPGGGALPIALAAHVLEFQVSGGRVAGGWDAEALPFVDGSPRTVLVAEFDAEFDGLEFMAVTSRTLEYYAQTAPGQWSQIAATSLASDAGRTVVGGALLDVERDGRPEVVVVRSGDSDSSITVYEFDEAGDLVEHADLAEETFPAAGVHAVAAIDLDAQGDPEILAFHPGNRAIGHLTVFALTEVPPDPATIDPLVPETLQPRPGWERTDNPVPSFDEATRVSAVDLGAGGLLDLVVETVGGDLVLFQNASSPGAPFALRRAGVLRGRFGGSVDAAAWADADYDGDGDADLIVWDADGALLFENQTVRGEDGAVTGGLLEELAPPIELPELSVGIGAPTAAFARDLDGDGGLDVLLRHEGGDATLALLTPEGVETAALIGPVGGRGPVAIADVNGDSGLDILLFPEGDSAPVLQSARDVTPPAAVTPSAFRIAPGESGIVDSELRVSIRGDLSEIFSGYSIALDYDNRFLDLERFEPPDDLAAIATFVTCPDANGVGCAGNAAVTMSYSESVRGAASQDVFLGRFVFSIAPLTEAATTEIELESFQSGGATFENTLAIVDGEATLSLPVDVSGGIFSVELQPPAPPDLVAQCFVDERRPDETVVSVEWVSPSEKEFSGFEVFVSGSRVATLGAAATGATFTTPLTGELAIEVQGRSGDELATASCQIVAVHEPLVECEAISAAENRVTWSLGHLADRFNVYRNGNRIARLGGDAQEFTDRSPSQDAADLYEVSAELSGIEGSRGECAGGPVGDPNVQTTEPPTITQASLVTRTSARQANVLRLRWTNGEGYSSIALALARVVDGAEQIVLETDLAGTATEFLYDGGDPLAGGVPPGEYRFTLVGVTDGIESDAVQSGIVPVTIPALSVGFDCAIAGNGDIQLGWDAVWPGYDDVTLRIEHRINGVLQGAAETVSVGTSVTEYTISEPIALGVYSFRLRAVEDTIGLPPSVIPAPEALQQNCELSFSAGLSVGTVHGGIGLSQIEIPIRAQVFGAISAFHFELEYPDIIDIDSATGLLVDALGANATLVISAGSSPGTNRASVDVTGVRIVPDADGDGTLDGEVIVARLVGAAPSDFALAGTYPLTFVGAPTFRFGVADTPVAAVDGELELVQRYVVAESVDLPPDSDEPFTVRVFGTFVETVPDYKLNSFAIHIRFDHELLELLPVTQSDQAGSAVEGLGTTILPNAQVIEAANNPASGTTGQATIAWLGFNLRDPNVGLEFLHPGTMLNLVTFKFRPRAGAAAAGSTDITFVTQAPGVSNPTAFFPAVDVLGEPDLEAFFPGSVRFGESEAQPELFRMEPSVGSLLGGQEAALVGAGFRSVAPEDIGVRLRRTDGPGAPADLDVSANEILEIRSDRIRFIVPDSGLRPQIAPPSVYSADVILEIAGAELIVPDGFEYEFPRLDGGDRTAGSSDGGDLLVLTGAGFAPETEVGFRFADATVDATVDRVDSDGRRVHVITPALSGREGQIATIEVRTPGIVDLQLQNFFTVLDPDAGPTLRLVSVTPGVGSICGGETVTLTGEAFAPGLAVSFGGVAAESVTVESATSATVVVPAVLEGTGTVTVTATLGASSVNLADAFTFMHPAPPFIRGDVNEDESVSVADVVVLSDLVVGAAEMFPANFDAADVNDDGIVDGGDVTALMDFLFGAGTALPQPHPEPGLDPTPDALKSCTEVSDGG